MEDIKDFVLNLPSTRKFLSVLGYWRRPRILWCRCRKDWRPFAWQPCPPSLKISRHNFTSTNYALISHDLPLIILHNVFLQRSDKTWKVKSTKRVIYHQRPLVDWPIINPRLAGESVVQHEHNIICRGAALISDKSISVIWLTGGQVLMFIYPGSYALHPIQRRRLHSQRNWVSTKWSSEKYVSRGYKLSPRR